MRKIIDRKLYDTATSTRIFPPNDVANPLDGLLPGLQSSRETLYRSPKGQLFVCRSSSLQSLGGGRTFVEESIYLLDEERVAQWLEAHNAPEAAYQAAGLQVEIG